MMMAHLDQYVTSWVREFSAESGAAISPLSRVVGRKEGREAFRRKGCQTYVQRRLWEKSGRRLIRMTDLVDGRWVGRKAAARAQD